MNTKQHPDNESLKEYVRHADSEDFTTLRLHLATCRDCRAQVDALSALVNHYQCLKSETCNENQQQHIFDYVDGHLSKAEMQETKASIETNPEVMKAALHYASHNAAMREVVHENGVNASRKAITNKTSLVNVLKDAINKWLDVRAPVWLTVPATAVAVAMVVVALQNTVPVMEATVTVASYQDNAVMRFIRKDPVPGIGFFSKADKYTKPYNNIVVNILSNGDINLMWPTVKDAVKYKIRLQNFNNGQKTIIDEISTKKTQATFKINSANMNRRYEWVLTGQTHDEMTFYASGGFVMDKTR